MLERAIERRLVDQVRKKLGGLALKWTSPGVAGVPDRIVFLPGGRVALVECKAPGKKPTELQLRVHQRLADLGAEVWVLDSVEAVDAWVGTR